MDWRSDEGSSLLRRAYPDGFLARRGVLTLGGLLVTSVEDSKFSRQRVTFSHGTNGYLVFERRRGDFFTTAGVFTNARAWESLRRGELLPLPDTADPATWACLLADLQFSVWQCESINPVWFPMSRRDGCWRLASVLSKSNGGPAGPHRDFDTDTQDPTEALVRAKISVNNRPRGDGHD